MAPRILSIYKVVLLVLVGNLRVKIFADLFCNVIDDFPFVISLGQFVIYSKMKGISAVVD